MTGDNTTNKEKYRQSYRIMELMKAGEKEKAPLREAYKEWYGETIDKD